MRKTILAGVCAGTLVALSMGLVQSAPSAGTTLSVRSLKARLMSSPQFLGSSTATLRRGARVKMISAKGSWYQVSYGATRGWLHKNRVTKTLIKLTAGGTGGGTTRGEAELAGRGFSPKTEKAFKDKNPNLDYSHVDKIQGFDIEPDSVAKFHQEGKITGPTKKKGGGS